MADDATEVTDGGDDDFLGVFSVPDSRDAGPAPPAPGRVDATMRLPDGTVLRVATVVGEIRLTIAGPDGMATAGLSSGDSHLLSSVLSAGEEDLRRMRREGSW